jgi:hypothetical protein
MIIPDDPPSKTREPIRHLPDMGVFFEIARRVAEDIGGKDKRRALTDTDVRDADAVGGCRVLNGRRGHRRAP